MLGRGGGIASIALFSSSFLYNYDSFWFTAEEVMFFSSWRLSEVGKYPEGNSMTDIAF